MDISNYQRTAADIFTLVLEEGPLTLYSASRKSKVPLGTIHRHFKELEASEKIKIYSATDNRRKKIPYGPTVYGMASFYKNDRRLRPKIENYFLRWLDQIPFVTDLKKEGFDVEKIKNAPHKSKILFRKYVQYLGGVEEQIDLIKEGSIEIPRDILIFIGGGLLSMKPGYEKIWEQLYAEMPGIRKALDDHLENSIKLQRYLKKKYGH